MADLPTQQLVPGWSSDMLPPPAAEPPPPPPPPGGWPAVPLDGIAEAAVIRPGDELVVRVDRACSAEHARRIKDLLAERLPDVKVTVIAAEQIAVVRRDGADRG